MALDEGPSGHPNSTLPSIADEAKFLAKLERHELPIMHQAMSVMLDDFYAKMLALCNTEHAPQIILHNFNTSAALAGWYTVGLIAKSKGKIAVLPRILAAPFDASAYWAIEAAAGCMTPQVDWGYVDNEAFEIAPHQAQVIQAVWRLIANDAHLRGAILACLEPADVAIIRTLLHTRSELGRHVQEAHSQGKVLHVLGIDAWWAYPGTPVKVIIDAMMAAAVRDKPVHFQYYNVFPGGLGDSDWPLVALGVGDETRFESNHFSNVLRSDLHGLGRDPEEDRVLSIIMDSARSNIEAHAAIWIERYLN